MNDPFASGARPPQSPLDQEGLELAALYALAALSPAETETVERERKNQHAFWDEVRSLRDVAAGLAEAGPRARPRRDLWPEIRARVQGASSAGRAPARNEQPWKHWPAGASADLVMHSDADAFEPTDIEGITVRRLAVDPAADRVTMLVRMAPGTAYPAHRHGGAEECFVLEGDLEIGSGVETNAVEMKAGDFQRMERESVHAVQSTRGGCLLLITSSRTDELLG